MTTFNSKKEATQLAINLVTGTPVYVYDKSVDSTELLATPIISILSDEVIWRKSSEDADYFCMVSAVDMAEWGYNRTAKYEVNGGHLNEICAEYSGDSDVPSSWAFLPDLVLALGLKENIANGESYHAFFSVLDGQLLLTEKAISIILANQLSVDIPLASDDLVTNQILPLAA